MFETDEEVEEFEALDEEDLEEDLQAAEDEEEFEAGEEEEAEESTSASLDELLAQREAARRAAGEPEDDDDIMSLRSEPDDVREPVTPRVVPIKQFQEFVCNRCRLVKAKSQLADPQRGLCRDCV
jgi:Domain of unknown function (DUF4193)